MNDPDFDQKREQLLRRFNEYGPVAVAFSGGVDSAVVAVAAFKALGPRACAVLSVSPALPQSALEDARSVAREIGIQLIELPTEEFENSDYRANDGRRCYFCKQTLYSSIALHRDRLGFRTIVNGTNCDDLGDYRPGLIAAEEHEVRSPLVEAGFHKQDVRQLAREWNIPIWDKPASPCLSSRVAYGVEVTPQRVERIDAGERFLRELLKVKELRVRLEAGELARIELPIEHLIQLTDPQVRQQVVDYFLQLGFNCITLDLAGFRSGGFNSRLEQNDLVRLTTMPRQ